MTIAVASGKGGTGKTTVAVNLAAVVGDATLIDCDVEEPNAHLFLRGTVAAEPEVVTVPVPVVDDTLCDGCGACARFCEYKALAVLGKRVLVFNELCHSCGGCVMVCPQKALREAPQRIGKIEYSQLGELRLLHGRLDVGVPMAPPLIRALQAKITATAFTILDAPPGTACPMVVTLCAADYVLLVTEPTPFGLHDLQLAVAVVKELQKPCGVVINRSDCADARAQEYCASVGIPVLAEIPDDRRIAEAYSRGRVIVEVLPEYQGVFENLAQQLRMPFKGHCAATRDSARTEAV